jgi:predicted PurR-regulated permease PerM
MILDEKKFSKYFLLAMFFISLVMFLIVIKVFIIQMLIAVIITTLVYPMQVIFLKAVKNRKNLASFLSCAVVLLAVFIPLIFISNLVVVQGIELYHNAQYQIKDIIEKGNEGIIGRITATPFGAWLSQFQVDWESMLEKALSTVSSQVIEFISASSKMTITLFFDLFIVMFSLFYFLRDGNDILKKVREFIPLSNQYKDRIISKFYLMANATIKGIIVIALLQSFFATLTLYFFGIKAWLLWGFVMLVLSFIPFVGTAPVLIPTGIIKIVTGSPVQGICIILISVFFISMIDNVLRPRVVGGNAGMHDLLVFFSMIGGIFTFGPAGLVIGPLLAAVFLSILEIYKIEFQPHIDQSNV